MKQWIIATLVGIFAIFAICTDSIGQETIEQLQQGQNTVNVQIIQNQAQRNLLDQQYLDAAKTYVESRQSIQDRLDVLIRDRQALDKKVRGLQKAKPKE